MTTGPFRVEIIVRDARGAVVADVSGSAHEPLRWTPDAPVVDQATGLRLHRILYDPDSRPLELEPPAIVPEL